MTKIGKITYAYNGEVFSDAGISIDVLSNKHLYKTLSLLCASRAHIHTLPTLLLLEPRYELVEKVGELWGWPLMIRLDYSIFPKQKPLGGIPVYTFDAAKRISDFLFSINCFPLFHKHADRFEDEYSVGVLIEPKAHMVQAEVVGKGFDAGDLRLGKSRPHEVFSLDMLDSRIRQDASFDADSYKFDADQRKTYACKLSKYVRYVNEQCQLLPEIEGIEHFDVSNCNMDFSPPDTYTPLKPSLKVSLLKTVEAVYYEVVNQLPPSQVYVASFSYLPAHGWLLWDIYGHWYKR